MPDPLRRVVTATGPDGRSCVGEDAAAPRGYDLQRLGASAAVIWDVPVADPDAGGDPHETPLEIQPPPGHVRVLRVVTPPAHTIDLSDPQAILREIGEQVPSLFAVSDLARGPWMHRTETTDVLYVASGSMDLVLEQGTVTLHAGDAVVQRGTWHAWRNPYDEPCVAIVTMVRAAHHGA